MIGFRYLFLIAMLVAGCGTQRPVLYPNHHLEAVGPTLAAQDIAACEGLADAYVKSHPTQDVVKGTAVGGGAGALIGAAGGAVTGRLGTGAAIGAATGATSGFLHSLFKASEPSPLFKSFVQKCLREKGYEVVGWQ